MQNQNKGNNPAPPDRRNKYADAVSGSRFHAISIHTALAAVRCHTKLTPT
jgi:hypothetical protein